jgi:hypothetical protein
MSEISVSANLELIRKIVAQGGSKYTSGAVDRRKYELLVGLGWLTSFSTNLGDVVYEATDKGKAAAKAA